MLILLIVAPPLLALAAVLWLVGPVSRPEHLGVTQGIAATGVLVGILALDHGGIDPLAWLAAGGAVAVLGIARYRLEIHDHSFSSSAIRQRWPPGTHAAVTAVALAAAGSALMVIDGPAARADLYDGVPTVLLAAGPGVLVAAPIILGSPVLRAVACGSVALLLGLVAVVPSLMLSFYYLPAAVALAATVTNVRVRSERT